MKSIPFRESQLNFREVYPSDFRGIIKLVKAAYFPDELPLSFLGTRFDDLEGAPWIWYGNSALSWVLSEIDGEVVVFSLSRRVKRHVHLHAIFVDSRFQRQGIGRHLMIRHWKQWLQEYPEIDSFSVNVFRENSGGRRFYRSLGYQEVDQLSIDPNQDSGIGDWIRNCQAHNDWPLRESLSFYIKFAAMIVWNENSHSK